MYIIIKHITESTKFVYIADSMVKNEYTEIEDIFLLVDVFMIFPEFVSISEMAIEKQQIQVIAYVSGASEVTQFL